MFLIALRFFFIIAVGLFFALFSAPFAVQVAKKLGAIDLPDSASHKRHTVPMPLAGGLIILGGGAFLFFLFGFWKEPSFIFIFLAGIVIFVFGLLDDIYGLSAPKKFFGQILASAILVYAGISVRFLETVDLPLSSSLLVFLNHGLSFFWLVGITNAFNLIDSMDGLVAGLTLIIASFFTFITLVSGQTALAFLSAMLVGLSIGLYFYNKHPARFFLGDSGAQLFGFFLAVIALLYRPPDLNPKSTWFVPILLLGVPIFDTSLVVVSRLRRRKPIFQADRSHTYHRLVQLGLKPNIAVLIIQISALILSLIAFVTMFLPPSEALTIFGATILLGVLSIVLFERVFV